MPRPVDRTETIDLHAPWWSEATEPSGRYVERWVVRKEMSEKNQQVINSQLNPTMKMPNANGGRGGRNGNATTAAEVVMQEMPYSRMYTLLEMTVEITDERGQPQHLTKDLIASLPTKDTEWVDNELKDLYAAPSIEPTEDDETAARMLREKAEYEGKAVPDEATADAQAVLSFHQNRKAPVRR